MRSIIGQKTRLLFRNYQKMFSTLIVIGIIAVLLSVLTHFTSLTDTIVDTTSTVPIKLDSPEFYIAVESIVGSAMLPLSADEKVEILNNGDEFLPDFLNEINNAKRSVTITTYIWRDGEMLRSILDALIVKAKQGIQVKLVLDGKGALRRPKDKIKELIDAGGEVETFRPLTLRALTRIHKRTHIRAMAIDGRVAYVGGLSFDDGWLGDGTGGKDKWRDVMFKVTGLPARHVQDMFHEMWRQTNGEILSGEDFYPTLDPVMVGSSACDQSCFNSLFHAPSADLDKDLSQLIWLTVMAAQDHIYLETPYLLPDKNILDALIQRSKEGLKVEIVVPGPFIDSRIVQAASKSYYQDVLDAGIKLYEYQSAGFHSKIITVDGQWSIIGSPNLDNRSSTLNVEGILVVKDEALAQNIEKEFEIDKSRSVLVTVETHHKQNAFIKFLGKVSRLFAKQY